MPIRRQNHPPIKCYAVKYDELYVISLLITTATHFKDNAIDVCFLNVLWSRNFETWAIEPKKETRERHTEQQFKSDCMKNKPAVGHCALRHLMLH